MGGRALKRFSAKCSTNITQRFQDVRNGLLITGIILLILGILLALLLAGGENFCNSVLGQIGQASNPSTAGECGTIGVIFGLGILLGIIGFILIILGAILKSGAEKQAFQAQSATSLPAAAVVPTHACTKCGRFLYAPLPAFCPDCGTATARTSIPAQA